MITLYYGTGARDYEVLGPALHPDEWAEIKNAACRLLVARGKDTAAEYLAKYQFQLSNGTNFFGDVYRSRFRRQGGGVITPPSG